MEPLSFVLQRGVYRPAGDQYQDDYQAKRHQQPRQYQWGRLVVGNVGIVAAAAADEASLALGAEAVNALHEIGAAGDLRGGFRWGHAIIGAKGAQPGQAIEAMGAVQPATAAVGGAWRSPQVAAAVRRVAWALP